MGHLGGEKVALSVTWPSTLPWPPARKILETLEDGLGRTCKLRHRPIPQDYYGAIVFTARLGLETYRITIDYHDTMSINGDALNQTDLYFKLNYAKGGYETDQVVPGGYPTTGLDYYKYYRAYGREGMKGRKIDVLARFGYRYNGDTRRRAVELLASAQDLSYAGNSGKVRYSRFLREAALAKLCLDLPGNAPLSHRISEFLGIGTCLVSPRYPTRLPVLLEPAVHYVDIADDLSDLLDACRYYAAHDEERERIARAGQHYFEKYLHCDQLASYYIRTILDRLGKASARGSGASPCLQTAQASPSSAPA